MFHRFYTLCPPAETISACFPGVHNTYKKTPGRHAGWLTDFIEFRLVNYWEAAVLHAETVLHNEIKKDNNLLATTVSNVPSLEASTELAFPDDWMVWYWRCLWFCCPITARWQQQTAKTSLTSRFIRRRLSTSSGRSYIVIISLSISIFFAVEKGSFSEDGR